MPTDPTPSPADDLATAGQPADTTGASSPNSAGSSAIAAKGPHRADLSFMFAHPWHLVSLGFGAGLSRLAPGTAGTLFAWASYEVLNRYISVLDWGILIIGGFLAGIGITAFTAKRLRVEDPSCIVWDEIVAFWLVLLMITPIDFVGKLWAFAIFRFFDMVKPPPIRYFERRFKGGFGIMVDDLVAAFFTLLVIALWRMSV
ncbi:phosphatidylglycerophosphatase A [Paraburkholderia bannensis]|uniref:Phosphatidylglycerophosphatase A n=1 Tax=Paraburkholderia bannensis TaxID=765414 RepID=A0A7W9TZ09_9BURK|nr:MULTISPECIES: phosphatidylglycerophosphatase A [Paraburkholderia]MBB3257792.1 phosphatidylglycerophosphatase A [Paraburkholderia sp. WP4_3_2]MBB6102805.1 phosphatidylglycerophosphatase A [Paraburkholderia bannensis]